MNGNGGGGSANGGADSGVVTASGVPVVSDPNTVSQATNRDYAVPTSMALTADRPAHGLGRATPAPQSDGLTSLDASHSLTPYSSAPDGHVVADRGRSRPTRARGPSPSPSASAAARTPR